MTEPINAQDVSELAEIVRIVKQRAVFLITGFSDARSVRRQDAKTMSHGLGVEKQSLQPAAWHAVAEHQRVAGGVAKVSECKLTAVAESEAPFLLV